MIRIARILKGQECRQDDNLEALAIFDIEPSRMQGMNTDPAHETKDDHQDVPMKVVIQNLDRCRPNPSRRLLGHRNQYGWIRFPNDEAFLAFPFEFVSSVVGDT